MTDSTTLLVLAGIGVSPYSARGLTQTLNAIRGAANVRRNVNGGLRNLSEPQFRKYESTISCSDQDPPVCDGVWPGQLVTVDCVKELCYPTGGSPDREVVEGSTRTDGDLTFYRPRLQMMVLAGFNMSRAEYEAAESWSLQLEEV